MTGPRQPLTIVEIDVDMCSLTYGDGVCTAALDPERAPRKCFNTFRTCQDKLNFQHEVLTLRFAENVSGLPKTEGTIYPALQSVSERPGEINLSGVDAKSSALGKRASVTVSLSDFADDDRGVDKYRAERLSGAAQADGVGYEPAGRGLFFSRLLARAPYFKGRALRVLRGNVGQPLSAFSVARYVIDEWHGPNASGAVSIKAKDPLNLIDGERALAPEPSLGKLAGSLSDVATTASLTPAGIGETYPLEGRIAIGREVMMMTRVGDVLTLTNRGVDGTAPSAHDINDTVQVCVRYENSRADEIIFDLLTVQGPLDPSMIDAAEWQDEVTGILPGGFTRTIAQPTSIAVLVGEIGQHGLQTWWDPEAQKIRLRSNRPNFPGEEIRVLSDEASFLEGSLDVKREEGLRISALHFWHGLIDPTESSTEPRNYRKRTTAADLSAASENEYAQSAIKTIFSPWFGESGNDAAASVIAERLVSRFRDTPHIAAGKIDPNDAVGLGDIVRIETDQVVDDTGARRSMQAQIRKVVPRDTDFDFEAEEFVTQGRFGLIMDAAVDAENYDDATELERIEGCYIIDASVAEFEDGTQPYEIF